MQINRPSFITVTSDKTRLVRYELSKLDRLVEPDCLDGQVWRHGFVSTIAQ